MQDFFEKVVTKKKEHDKKKAEKKLKEGGSMKSPVNVKAEAEIKKEEESEIDELMDMSEDEDTKARPNSLTPITPLEQIMIGEGLKRKRKLQDEDRLDGFMDDDDEATPSKRPRSVTPPAPPPPPPLDMDTPEGSSEVHDSGHFEDALFTEDSSYVSGKLEDISYTDAPTNDSTYPIDGYETLCAEYGLSTQAAPQPPPPPPPPTNGVSHGVSHVGLSSDMYTIGCSYDQSLTPTTPNLDINDSQNQGLGSMPMQRSKYLEAQESN